LGGASARAASGNLGSAIEDGCRHAGITRRVVADVLKVNPGAATSHRLLKPAAQPAYVAGRNDAFIARFQVDRLSLRTKTRT
jgi:hypothetical protein